MGYYTHYNLEAWEVDTKRQIDESLESKIATHLARVAFEETDDDDYEYEGFDEILCGELKWDHHSEDMKLISKNYPNLVFLLHGTGEVHTDIWREWFHNGHSEYIRARVTFDIPQNDTFKGILVGEEL